MSIMNRKKRTQITNDAHNTPKPASFTDSASKTNEPKSTNETNLTNQTNKTSSTNSTNPTNETNITNSTNETNQPAIQLPSCPPNPQQIICPLLASNPGGFYPDDDEINLIDLFKTVWKWK